jgi:hypothetical protein
LLLRDFTLALTARSLELRFRSSSSLIELTTTVVQLWGYDVLQITVCVSHFQILRALGA